MAYYWVFSAPVASSNMLLSVLLQGKENQFSSLPFLVGRLLGEESSNTYSGLITPVCMSLSMACLLVFLVINYPRWTRSFTFWRDSTTERTVYLLRLVLAYAICLIPLGGYFLH